MPDVILITTAVLVELVARKNHLSVVSVLRVIVWVGHSCANCSRT